MYEHIHANYRQKTWKNNTSFMGKVLYHMTADSDALMQTLQ